MLGQVDNKFIACMVNTVEKDLPASSSSSSSSSEPNLLIMIDQHAAHERVRLEQLTAGKSYQGSESLLTYYSCGITED